MEVDTLTTSNNIDYSNIIQTNNNIISGKNKRKENENIIITNDIESKDIIINRVNELIDDKKYSIDEFIQLIFKGENNIQSKINIKTKINFEENYNNKMSDNDIDILNEHKMINLIEILNNEISRLTKNNDAINILNEAIKDLYLIEDNQCLIIDQTKEVI